MVYIAILLITYTSYKKRRNTFLKITKKNFWIPSQERPQFRECRSWLITPRDISLAPGQFLVIT